MPDEPDDPESVLLSEIWDRLERALELATEAEAMRNLAEVRRLCAEITQLINEG